MFLFKFENFFQVSGNWTSKKRNEVFDVQLTLNELEKVLGKSGNDEKAREDELPDENGAGPSTSEPGSYNTNTVKDVEEGGTTPIKKLKFRKATPNCKVLEKIQCSLCNKAYESLKALKLHAKKHHNGEGVDANAKEVQNNKHVTCMICDSKYPRDQVTRHLVQVHGYEKPSKNAVFRGFFTLNNITWKPLWLLKHEVEPPAEVLLRVDKEGRVSMHGVVFEANEVDEVKDIASRDDVQETFAERIGLKEAFNDRKNEKEEVSKNNQGTKIVKANIKKPIVCKDVTQGESESKQAPRDPPFYMRVLFPTERSPCELLEDLKDMYKSPDVKDLKDVFHKETEKDGDEVKGSPRRKKKNVGKKSAAVKNLKYAFENETENDRDESKGCPKRKNKKEESKDNEGGFNPNIEDEEYGSYGDDDDSDFDPEDSKLENDIRTHNKAIRKANRNVASSLVDLPKLEKNASVIEDFEKYLNHNKIGTCSDPSKLSSILKIRGHMYLYHDSFLAFEHSRDSKFNLQRLVSPKAEDFAELADPTEVDGWLASISGKDGTAAPGRRREMLKAHIKFRAYVHEKLLKEDFGKNAEDYLKRDMVLRKLESIKTNIENKKAFQVLNKLEEKGRKDRERARSILFPKSNFNEAHCVTTWFESEEAKQEEEECQEIYDRCMAGKKVPDKEFSKVGNWSRWTVACEDRNRTSVYKFTNLEFMQRKEKWLPEADKSDKSSVQERFENLPSTWDADAPPSEGVPPTCWVITVNGEGLKGQEDAQLVLTRRGVSSCLMFRDMKEICLKKEDEKGQFFVNKQGRALGRLQRTKGSLLEKFGRVTGVQKASMNTLRRAAEGQIQSSPIMKQNVEKLQLHSSSVGLKYYDKTAPNTRASFVAQLSNIESPYKEDKEVSAEIKKRRIEKDAKDKEAIINDAREILKQQKLARKPKRSRNNKISFQEREMLQNIYSVQIEKNYNGIFPGKLSVHFFILKYYFLLFRR